MIIGLIGPSCSGKSCLLKVLQDNLDFYIPIGITTRPERNEENGVLEHIANQEFIIRQQENKLCFVAESFGYYYAYPVFPSNKENIAIEIVRKNIPELKANKGYAIKIIPTDLNEGINRILAKRTHGTEERKLELVKEYYTAKNGIFDFVFMNNYDNESINLFLDLIKRLR